MPCSPEMKRLLDHISVQAGEGGAEALIERLSGARSERSAVVIAFLNQHGFNMACDDAVFRRALLDSDILLRDGAGLAWAMRHHHREPGLNMNGTDFIPPLVRAVLQRHPACGVHLYGTREPWLSTAAERLCDGRSRVVAIDGFQPVQRYLDSATADDAPFKLILLCMGMPRQELVAQQLRQSLQGPALIICGGAILDFVAGRVPRAPEWMRRSGLEWAYRLSREPARLFRRYVIGIPQFLWRVTTMSRTLPDSDRPSVSVD